MNILKKLIKCLCSGKTDPSEKTKVEKEKANKTVDEASEESFPASDAPSWISGVDKPAKHDQDK